MKRIDWTSVDLTRPTDELLRELGCAESTLRNARTVRGIKRPDKHSGGDHGGRRAKGVLNKNHVDMASISVYMLQSNLERCRELAEKRGQSISKTISYIIGEYFGTEEE